MSDKLREVALYRDGTPVLTVYSYANRIIFQTAIQYRATVFLDKAKSTGICNTVVHLR